MIGPEEALIIGMLCGVFVGYSVGFHYDAMARGGDPVLKDLAIIVMSEQTGSRWMASAAVAAIKEIQRLRDEVRQYQQTRKET